MKGRQRPIQVSNPTYRGVILEMGLALYERGGQGRRFPNWALVFHPESFLADDVRIYGISNDSKNWFLDFKTCSLRDSGCVVAVFKISDRGVRVPSMKVLDIFMSNFPPGKDGKNSNYESLWSSSSWVLRALGHFDTVVKLPCRTGGKLSGYIRQRMNILGGMQARHGEKIRVIPLMGEDDTMPSSSSSQALLPVLPILCAIAKRLRELEGKPPVRKPIMT